MNMNMGSSIAEDTGHLVMVIESLTKVDQNVSSGLALSPEHHQNLHELILGAPGVKLNQRLQQLVSKVEEHKQFTRRSSTDHA